MINTEFNISGYYYAHMWDKHQSVTDHGVAVEYNLNDICSKHIISLIGWEEVICNDFPEHINHSSSNYTPLPCTDVYVWMRTHACINAHTCTEAQNSANSLLFKMSCDSKLNFVISICFTCCSHALPCLWSKAGEWLMALEFMSPSDYVCLHFRLVMVLTSSFNRNHRSVCPCVCAVVHTQKNINFTSSYVDCLKNNELFLLSHMRFSHYIVTHHFSSPWSFAIICSNTPSLGNPRKFLLSLVISQVLRSHMQVEWWAYRQYRHRTSL